MKTQDRTSAAKTVLFTLFIGMAVALFIFKGTNVESPMESSQSPLPIARAMLRGKLVKGGAPPEQNVPVATKGGLRKPKNKTFFKSQELATEQSVQGTNARIPEVDSCALGGGLMLLFAIPCLIVKLVKFIVGANQDREGGGNCQSQCLLIERKFNDIEEGVLVVEENQVLLFDSDQQADLPPSSRGLLHTIVDESPSLQQHQEKIPMVVATMVPDEADFVVHNGVTYCQSEICTTGFDAVLIMMDTVRCEVLEDVLEDDFNNERNSIEAMASIFQTNMYLLPTDMIELF